MHLSGWNFTILDGHQSAQSMNVIDVKISDFFKAQELALQQYKPGSKLGCAKWANRTHAVLQGPNPRD